MMTKIFREWPEGAQDNNSDEQQKDVEWSRKLENILSNASKSAHIHRLEQLLELYNETLPYVNVDISAAGFCLPAFQNSLV